MAIICPTVTAENQSHFREQIERIVPFAKRIHLDFMDGLFTQNQSIALNEVWIPEDRGIQWDLHLMFMRPDLSLDHIVRLKPGLVIVQAESKGNFEHIANFVHAIGSRIGVSLLQDTPVSTIAPALDWIDHVLIFSGDLGHFGGKADLGLLSKVNEVKKVNSKIEVAWDGGINAVNAPKLVDGGVDVLNVGGFIQQSDNPALAYAKLEAIAGKAT
jgi:ribulose-phosphate 3-epimerase